MRTRHIQSANFLFAALAVASVVALYWPVLQAMVLTWANNENDSHGFIVPIVTTYLIWKRRDSLATQTVIPSLWGLLVIIGGLAMLLFGWLAGEYYTQRFSFIIVLSGCIIYWYGWTIMRLLAGPVAYLILMIPIPAIVYDAVAFPLKLFVTKVSVAVMKALGILVVREGNIMSFPNITLEVVDACSGLRSLTSLLAVGLAYIMLFVPTKRHKYCIAFLIFPIAIIANLVRVIGTGILSQYFGAAAAEGFFHEFAGLVIFMTSLFLLVAAHRLLVRYL